MELSASHAALSGQCASPGTGLQACTVREARRLPIGACVEDAWVRPSQAYRQRVAVERKERMLPEKSQEDFKISFYSARNTLKRCSSYLYPFVASLHVMA